MKSKFNKTIVLGVSSTIILLSNSFALDALSSHSSLKILNSNSLYTIEAITNEKIYPNEIVKINGEIFINKDIEYSLNFKSKILLTSDSLGWENFEQLEGNEIYIHLLKEKRIKKTISQRGTESVEKICNE
jgi:hypothetical protein